MNTQLDPEKLMMYVLDWLEPEEKANIRLMLESQPDSQEILGSAKYSLQLLERAWVQQQAARWSNKQLDIDERLLRITKWVNGELSAKEINLAQQDLMDDRRYKIFHDRLIDLSKALHSSFQNNLSRLVQEQLQRLLVPKTIGTQFLRPAIGFRGQTDTPLALTIPPEFDLQLKLFIGGFDARRRSVKGAFSTNQHNNVSVLTEIIDASVWLIPEVIGEKWHEAAVSENGSFSMTRVPPGNYVFEMAWPDNFIEIMDVTIPAA